MSQEKAGCKQVRRWRPCRPPSLPLTRSLTHQVSQEKAVAACRRLLPEEE